MLMLTKDKTDMAIISSAHFANEIVNSKVQIGDVLVSPNDSVRNLEVMFDKHLCLEDDINTTCKSSWKSCLTSICVWKMT